jgi:hypothetical protein
MSIVMATGRVVFTANDTAALFALLVTGLHPGTRRLGHAHTADQANAR